MPLSCLKDSKGGYGNWMYVVVGGQQRRLGHALKNTFEHFFSRALLQTPFRVSGALRTYDNPRRGKASRGFTKNTAVISANPLKSGHRASSVRRVCKVFEDIILFQKWRVRRTKHKQRELRHGKVYGTCKVCAWLINYTWYSVKNM